MKKETFIAIIIDSNRITVPKIITETYKIKKGSRVRVSIEVIE